jgi:hypothetical protein
MTIEWINYADAHLTFDASSRTLYLFRFPAYFAAAFLGGEETFLAEYTSNSIMLFIGLILYQYDGDEPSRQNRVTK